MTNVFFHLIRILSSGLSNYAFIDYLDMLSLRVFLNVTFVGGLDTQKIECCLTCFDNVLNALELACNSEWRRVQCLVSLDLRALVMKVIKLYFFFHFMGKDYSKMHINMDLENLTSLFMGNGYPKMGYYI